MSELILTDSASELENTVRIIRKNLIPICRKFGIIDRASSCLLSESCMIITASSVLLTAFKL
jgi:hypothetical protein